MLQGKTCHDSLLSGEGRSVGAEISGEGVIPGEYFLVSTKLNTFCYMTVQSECTVLLAIILTIPACDRRTDGETDRQTDGRKCHS